MSFLLRLLIPLVSVGLIACTAAPPASAPTTSPTKPAAAASPVASSPVASPAAKPVSSPSPAASPGAVAGPYFKSDANAWQRIQQTAKQEGRVVVTGPGFPGLRTGVVDGFQKAYGITVEYLGLPSGDVITRVDRESKAGKPTVDVNIGGTSSCWVMAERGQIDDATNLIVDPALFDSAVWRGGRMRPILPSPGLSKDFLCGIQTAEWVMTDLFVNTQVIPPGTITSWKDLLKPEYAGKIASFDPRRSGPGQTPVGYLNALFGEQYLQSLYVGQKVVFTTDTNELADWVAKGTHPIGIALVQAAIEPRRSAGLPIARLFPADGQGSLTGGFGTVQRIKNGPNPNAGALFMNWWASQQAQTMYEEAMMETSLRNDVPHKVPDYVIPKSGVSYPIDDYHPDYFFAKRQPAINKLIELLGR